MKKEIKNYVFVKNGEILSEFGTFSSRFTTSPSRPLMILFPLTILAFSDRLAISGYVSHGAHGALGHLVDCGGDYVGPTVFIRSSSVTWRPRQSSSGNFTMPWCMKLGSVLSGIPHSSIAFTLSASVEGGCKRMGRIPGVMRSHS